MLPPLKRLGTADAKFANSRRPGASQFFPSTCPFANRSAEPLRRIPGKRVVAEAHAGRELGLDSASAKKVQDAIDPFEFVARGMSCAGCEPAIRVSRGRGNLAVNHVSHCEVKSDSVGKPCEHVWEFAMAALHVLRDVDCLQMPIFTIVLFARYDPA